MTIQTNQATSTLDQNDPITVLINNSPITFMDRKVTGQEIKQTAISQGLPIQVDFVLYKVTPSGGHLKQIGDNEKVVLKPDDVFRAVAPDDNS